MQASVDAGAVRHSSLPTFAQTPFFLARLAELPLVVAELLRELLDVLVVLLVGRVRAVRAAALHQLGRRLGEHALAAVAEDAAASDDSQERDVDLPRVAPCLGSGT